MKAITTRTVINVELTIAQLAEIIVGLGSNEQAVLISEIAECIDFNPAIQLEYIRQDEAMTKEGRQLMRLIGDYAEAGDD